MLQLCSPGLIHYHIRPEVQDPCSWVFKTFRTSPPSSLPLSLGIRANWWITPEVLDYTLRLWQDLPQNLPILRPIPGRQWRQTDLGLWSQLCHLLAVWSYASNSTSKKLLPLLDLKKKKGIITATDGLAMRMKMTWVMQSLEDLDHEDAQWIPNPSFSSKQFHPV